jgi:hypothetical protein
MKRQPARRLMPLPPPNSPQTRLHAKVVGLDDIRKTNNCCTGIFDHRRSNVYAGFLGVDSEGFSVQVSIVLASCVSAIAQIAGRAPPLARPTWRAPSERSALVSDQCIHCCRGWPANAHRRKSAEVTGCISLAMKQRRHWVFTRPSRGAPTSNIAQALRREASVLSFGVRECPLSCNSLMLRTPSRTRYAPRYARHAGGLSLHPPYTPPCATCATRPWGGRSALSPTLPHCLPLT